MQRICNSRRWLRAAPGLGLVVGLVLGGAALASAASGDGETPGDYVAVTHVLYIGPDGNAISEEVSRTNVSAAFVVNGHIWGQDKIPVGVRYNPAGAPAEHNVPALIQQAMNTWNNSGASFSFESAGSNEAGTGACSNPFQADGANTIAFQELSGLTLAITCTLFPPGQGPNSNLVEFDMRIDTDSPWSSTLPVPAGRFDMATTILHELGHAAGIGHSSVQPSVMYFQLNSGQSKRELHQDDLDAVRAAYPPTATNTPTNTPTPTATPVTPTVQTPVPTLPTVNMQVRAPQLARD